MRVDTKMFDRAFHEALKSVRRFARMQRDSGARKYRVIDLDAPPDADRDKIAILEPNEVIIWRHSKSEVG